MKNRTVDVRNHLVAMLEELGEKDCTTETIERAKMAAVVATAFTQLVKVEIDAHRLRDDTGLQHNAIEPAQEIRDEPRVLSFRKGA